jgi:predicted methyltransferase
MRVGRPTLGGGLPGQATVIVDPDRFPQAGGLALVREGDAYRILAVAVGRDGRMLGYSTTPEHEFPLDTLDTADVAAIVAAQMV